MWFLLNICGCVALANFYHCISVVSYSFTNPESKQTGSKGDHSDFKVLSDVCVSLDELSTWPFPAHSEPEHV